MSEDELRNALEVLSAISIVRDHLASEWISEGCREHQSFGCASCQAVLLDLQLEILADSIAEDGHAYPISPRRKSVTGEV